MKKIIITSSLIGICISLYFYFNYKNNLSYDSKSEETVYFLQIGAYENYENAVKLTQSLEYSVIEKENNLYHVYIGITKYEENIEKLESLYSNSETKIYLKNKIISSEKFLDKLEKYDYVISTSENEKVINNMNEEILKNYNNIVISKI